MKSLKIIISLLAVVCILSTSIFSLSSITASATTVPDIRLHSSEFVIKAARGLYTRDIYIKVRDTEKYGRTFVHYETAPGKAWTDVEAVKLISRAEMVTLSTRLPSAPTAATLSLPSSMTLLLLLFGTTTTIRISLT